MQRNEDSLDQAIGQQIGSYQSGCIVFLSRKLPGIDPFIRIVFHESSLLFYSRLMTDFLMPGNYHLLLY